ncbi:MAG: hypothetical protein AB7O32_11060 [Vicinamibacterales bacterium]
MTRRMHLATIAAAVSSLAVASLSAQAPVAGAGKAPAASTTAGSPRTPWGAPDLQGLWSNALITPLERPKALGTKAFFTEEEARAREAKAIADATDEARGKDAKADVAGAYNDFWWDRGTKDVGTRRTSLIVSPADGRIPWRPEVLKANQDRSATRNAMLDNPSPVSDWLQLDTGERCITDGIPWVPYAYNNNYQIVQSPNHVVILHEQFREMRVIPIGAKPAGNVPQWFGTSWGRWEGDTLVVETDNIADRSRYNFANDWRQVRPSYTLVEKFTRKDGGLQYEFTVTDPTLFTSPWTAQTLMTKADGALFEYACHEGNYSMVSMLGNKQGKK